MVSATQPDEVEGDDKLPLILGRDTKLRTDLRKRQAASHRPPIAASAMSDAASTTNS